MFDAVRCAIPGAKRPSQVAENVAAADLPKIPDDTMRKIDELYKEKIKPLVQPYW
jgi:aryl-alcohol dehydrogenase-like predicted oxidoreductase